MTNFLITDQAFTWNSVMSTLRAPSKRREAVNEEMTWAINLGANRLSALDLSPSTSDSCINQQ